MNLLDPTATEKQTTNRIEMLAIPKRYFKVVDFLRNQWECSVCGSWHYIGTCDCKVRVDAIILNDWLLEDVDLFGKKREDFDDLESCVYSHLVDIGRGDIDMGQVFKSK